MRWYILSFDDNGNHSWVHIPKEYINSGDYVMRKSRYKIEYGIYRGFYILDDITYDNICDYIESEEKSIKRDKMINNILNGS